MTAYPVKRWDDSVTRINKLHEQVQEHAQNAIDVAISLGELLIAQKKGIPHGDWLTWVENNLEFSERTARNYMRVARQVSQLEGENRQRVADLSFRDALKALATDSSRLSKLPEPDIDDVFEAAQDKPLRSTITRATTAHRVRERQRHCKEHQLTAVKQPVVIDSLAAPRLQMPSWRVALRDRVLALARETMAANNVTANDVVEALQDAYCDLQDGSLS